MLSKLTKGNFEFEYVDIGCCVITPRQFHDERGYFQETFSERHFMEGGLPSTFKQDNHSFSTAGVLRGLHIQVPHHQGKLVRVTSGKVYDVAVDLRPHSKTFGKWFGIVLSAENKKMMYVPTGFAHGFLAIDASEFLYKCTDTYQPGEDYTIRYDDPTLAIDWGAQSNGYYPADFQFNVSEKDKKGLTLKEFLAKGLVV